MKTSDLRLYVLQIFEDGKEYDQQELKQKVDEHFGEGIYTDVQVHNLIYNLLRKEEIQRTDNKKYIISKKRSFTGSGDFYTLDQYSEPIKEWCATVKNDIDKPGYLSRFSKEKRNEIELVYELNQKIIAVIDECLESIND